MKKLKYILAATAILFAAGCKKDEPTMDAPHWSVVAPSTSDDPQWQVADEDIDLNSTMTIIAATDNMSKDDRLAVFCDGVCVGTAEPVEVESYGWRFFTCVYMPANPDMPLTFAYYSATRHSICYWPDEMLYEHDGILGMASNPYNLSATTAMPYSHAVTLPYTLPEVETISPQDEIAAFVGEECRAVVSGETYLHESIHTIRVALKDKQESCEIRYYNAKQGKIYRL